MKSHWETHKGKKIFWAIYGNMPMDEYRAEIAAVEKELKAQPEGSVLLLVDSTNQLMSPEALDLGYKMAQATDPYVHASAILGVKGVHRFFFSIAALFSKPKVAAFSNAQQAMDFLVKS